MENKLGATVCEGGFDWGISVVSLVVLLGGWFDGRWLV